MVPAAVTGAGTGKFNRKQMSYTEFHPHQALAPYIDAYWRVRSDDPVLVPVTERIMPDCCVDIILNPGSDTIADADGFMMRHGKAYLVGTMTRWKETVREKDTHLVGIRFKPGAFDHFYRWASLHETTDRIVEFEGSLSPGIGLLTGDFTGRLDEFFGRRLQPPRDSILPFIGGITATSGQVTVAALAKTHYTSPRQLQRLFRRRLGIGPKEFISFTRYQTALRNIKRDYARKTLLDIAFDSGYYDHAHLTNEVRKYAGLTPSQL
jgi:AraC-like DNA-binding protein